MALMGKRAKILVSTYCCEPDKGSEPGVGWNCVRQIARFHEVWAITQTRNRRAIERALDKEPMPHVHWVYFDLPWWADLWRRRMRGVRLYYYFWQFGVYFLGKRLHDQVAFDLVHHVTFCAYWLPSFLVLLPVPFVWGPVGGAESTPRAFYKTFSLRNRGYELMRKMTQWLCEKDPIVALDSTKSRVVFATAQETAQRLGQMRGRSVELLSQVGLPAEELLQLTMLPLRHTSPFRLISVGRLLHWKGFHLGLTAFARFQQQFPDSEYWIVGDGPQRRDLERLARHLEVSMTVRFWGNLPRSQVFEKLADCDVLMHPSLHDSGGYVCLEAMAAGRPVLCLDLGGPALQVTDRVGVKVPAISPEQVVDDFAKAMGQLARDPALRVGMAEAARERVAEQFAWDQKGERIREVYQGILGRCL
jgi:glycosyltransferase involved in cell wall biosynthesis